MREPKYTKRRNFYDRITLTTSYAFETRFSKFILFNNIIRTVYVDQAQIIGTILFTSKYYARYHDG